MYALSSVDGRYRNYTKNISEYFSEFGFIKYRIHVEITYFIKLLELNLPELSDFKIDIELLINIYKNFSRQDFDEIKAIEKITNHDVKSIECFIKNKFLDLDIHKKHTYFIHFALTSQDINNTATSLSIKQYIDRIYLMDYVIFSCKLKSLISEYRDKVMLSFTHGQPAVPTTMGKELKVFDYRLSLQIQNLKNI